MSYPKAKAFLAQMGFADRIIVFEASTATVALAAAALGVEDACIAKSVALFADKTPILVLTDGVARIDNRKFKETFHAKAKMIPFDEVEANIGHAPGGVSPFGRNASVPVYLDESLKRHARVYPAAGDDHTAVDLSVAELAALTGGGWVDVTKGD